MADLDACIIWPPDEMLTRLHACESRARQLDVLYDWGDEILAAGKFEELDTFIRDLDMSQFETSIILGWLTITNWARQQLPNRPMLVEHSRAVITERDPARVDKLLLGLF